ncbi:MAG TPA: thiamine/thiamine pyrophosphate ABC transporter, permease protein [Rhodobacteraceae bacterium]|nr:thiamine/thiamine pyrophosphate ABC transporter, permease protein [Paracoccaceae bacterium]
MTRYRPFFRILPGLAAALVLAGLVGGSLLALAAEAGHDIAIRRLGEPYLLRVILFTLVQAALSALLSVALAIPAARALYRWRGLPGHTLVLHLLSLAFVTPVIIGVFGIVAVHGKSGWINSLLNVLGVEPRSYIYGLTGILIGHLFFNYPFAIRLLLRALDDISAENWRLADQLDLRGWNRFRFLEWPAMRRALPAAASLIFALCFTSFAVVLTLGGGPRATTIEVAIYQALRFDFDLGQALLLALVQVSLGLLMMALIGRANIEPLSRTGLRHRHGGAPEGPLAALTDILALLPLLGLVIAPLTAILLDGLRAPLATLVADSGIQQAALRSAGVALAAAVAACLLALGLLSAARRLKQQRQRPGAARFLLLSGSVILVVPPMLLGTGLFLLLRRFGWVLPDVLVLVTLINALTGLPFALRLLEPRFMAIERDYGHLCASLDIKGWARLRHVELPQLARPLGQALALCAALSAGDLGVIVLFGTPETATLPLLLYQYMGAYRLHEAAGIALLLAIICLGLIIFAETPGKRHA